MSGGSDPHQELSEALRRNVKIIDAKLDDLIIQENENVH